MYKLTTLTSKNGPSVFYTDTAGYVKSRPSMVNFEVEYSDFRTNTDKAKAHASLYNYEHHGVNSFINVYKNGGSIYKQRAADDIRRKVYNVGGQGLRFFRMNQMNFGAAYFVDTVEKGMLFIFETPSNTYAIPLSELPETFKN